MKKVKKAANKLNSFRKSKLANMKNFRFQEAPSVMPGVVDNSKSVLSPAESTQANLFLDNLAYSEENNNRDLLEVIN